ncbi:hypothetical protein AM592_16905 [Bacillus gobiensis]|uniref:Histidine kinase domain-containing protein n=2 Tax=Bacillus TaxID=1386 RepID=A0A0M5JF32_9BACI|nr:hypothetical protein AM592_16905 [Bacillus gobiensis]
MIFFLSIIESFVYLFLVFTIFGIDWARFKKHAVCFIGLLSLFKLLLFLKFPIELTMIAHAIFNIFLLRNLYLFSWSVAALISLSQLAIQSMVENIMIHLCDVTSLYYLKDKLEYSVRELLIMLGIDFLLFLIGLFFYLKKISFLKWFTVQHTEFTNYLLFLMGVFLIQDELISLISIRNLKMTQQSGDYFIIISMISIGIMGITMFLLYSFGKKLELQTMEQTERVYLRNIGELISSVRAQRHDYHNHMQVISGLIHRKEYEEVSEYLNELNVELQSQQAILHLNHTALSALFQAKKEIAQVHHVTMKIDAYTSIPSMEIKSFELVQILGNLLDNAIEEEIKVPSNRRMIKVTIDRMMNSMVVFHVHNLNSWIEANKMSIIFQEGYTTKEGHKGIGLLTAKRLSLKYQSHIEVESDPESGTTFSVFIPFSKKKE